MDPCSTLHIIDLNVECWTSNVQTMFLKFHELCKNLNSLQEFHELLR